MKLSAQTFRPAVSVLLVVLGIALLSVVVRAQPEGGAIVAIDAPAGYGGAAAGARQGVGGQSAVGQSKTAAGRRTSTGRTSTKTSAVSKTVARPAPAKWDGFVIGDKYSFLNFEVVSAVKPYYTRDAKAGGAHGLVQVEVLIDTNGNVLTARARTGDTRLHAEAERAALESKFNRPTVYGKPARAIGFLVYRFGPADD